MLVVISDQTSESTEDEIKQATLLLENNNIRVIPVALGSEADIKELSNATFDEDDVVKAERTDDPENVADQIIMKASKRLYGVWDDDRAVNIIPSILR